MIPSQFGAFVLNEFRDRDMFIDIGCGSGKDSWFFYHHGKHVTGIDGSSNAIDRNNQRSINLDSINFRCLDFNDAIATAECANRLRISKPMVIYSRFFLHSINETAEENFLKFCDIIMDPNDVLCLEYRTLQDQHHPKDTTPHYRRFIDPDLFADRCRPLGLEVRYSRQGQGYAKLGNDDAWVCRQILSR